MIHSTALRRTFAIALSIALAACTGAATASETYQSEHYRLRLVTVAQGLEQPWSLAWLPDGRMLVTEKEGRLRVVAPDGSLGAPVRGLPKISDDGQGGLLDVLVDPDFAANRTIYFSFSEPGRVGSGTAVARAVLQDNALHDLKIVFRQEPKSSGGRHFGSRIVMARDGTLFVTLGDRGERDRVQDPTINRGQVVRINKDGSIPADNPFVGREGYRPETWSHGHRNPQGAAIHPITGKLWTAEHGARGGDEINVPLPGRNYGWPVISYGTHYSGFTIGEGTHKPGMEQPVHYWDPSIAPADIAFYTGDKFPKWKGNLLVAALKYQLIARLELDGEKVIHEERILTELDERIRDVDQGPDGYIYLITDSGDGRIIRVEPAD